MIDKMDKINGTDLREKGRKWIAKIEAAGLAEKSWMDDAKKAREAYTGEGEEASTDVTESIGAYDFNILFSNVETIVPAIINSPPIPDIRRRFGDADPVARGVAEILERAIRIQVDDGKLQEELEGSAQDAELAGRGIVRMRFWSDIVGQGETTDDEIEDAAEGEDDTEGEGSEPGSGSLGEVSYEESYGQEPQPLLAGEGYPGEGADNLGGGGQDARLAMGANGGPPLERVENERITFEAISWTDYRHGPAKRWEDRPWDAYRFCIAREDEEESFSAALIAAQLEASEAQDRKSSDKDLTGWEVWCKKTRKVYFIDDSGVILREVDDPLGLSQFFPIAKPMQPIEVNGRLMPVNPFKVYRKIASDLDDAVQRKSRLIDQMRVKGWNGLSEGDLAALRELDDGDFAPIKDPEMWAQSGGIEKAVAFWPLDKFIVAIQQLDAAINTYKQWIYEITGISDIVRGASLASETATAQNIKNQWGSLRIQKRQRMLERCARELFVMMAEVISSKFSPQTLQDMTAIPLMPVMGEPEEVMQKKQAMLDLMQQRLASYYRIDVESDSTIRADLTRQKNEVAQFLQGAAAYFQAVGPLVQQGTIPAEAAAEIFAANARLFNLGRSVEDVIENMVVMAKQKSQEMAQQAQQPDPAKQAETQKMIADGQRSQAEADKAKAEAQKMMAEAAQAAQGDGVGAQHDAILKSLEVQLKQLTVDTAQINLEIKQAELAGKQAENAGKAMDAVNNAFQAQQPIMEAM